SASHIQNPACFVGDSRDHLIDEGFARLPLRLRPCAPVPEIEIAAVPVVATLIAAAHHAVISAGTHRPAHGHHPWFNPSASDVYRKSGKARRQTAMSNGR